MDSDATTSPEDSMVGTWAGSGAVSLGFETEASEVAVSLGLETDASELAFPVISELVGEGVTLECLVGQLQV